MSEDSNIHCLKRSGIAAHAASRISQLSGEMLAAPDNDDDPFLTLDDNPFLTLDDDLFLTLDDYKNERNDCQGYGLTSSS